MSFNTYRLHRLNSFEEAKSWHNAVKPVRGTTTRPLGSRRYHFTAHITMPDPDTVELMYGREPLVRWHSDNSLEVCNARWVNGWAMGNIMFYLPKGLDFVWEGRRGGKLFVHTHTGDYEVRRGTPVKFALDEQGMFDVVTKKAEYNIRMNRAVMNKLMKQVEPFLGWLSVVDADGFNTCDDDNRAATVEHYDTFALVAGVDRLGIVAQYDASMKDANRGYDPELWAAMRGAAMLPRIGPNGMNVEWHRPSAELLLNMVTDETAVNWGRARYVVYHSIKVGWRQLVKRPTVEKFLRELVLYVHRDTALRHDELPVGVRPSSTNTQFYNDFSFPPLESSTVGR